MLTHVKRVAWVFCPRAVGWLCYASRVCRNRDSHHENGDSRDHENAPTPERVATRVRK